MTLLLDSQAVFWTLLNDSKLSMAATDLIADPNNDCLISPVSHWEMAMKISVRKYRIHEVFQALWRRATTRFTILPIEPRHSARLIDLPFHHKDPFDRMLVAQALAEDIPLVSCDKQLDAYGVQCIW